MKNSIKTQIETFLSRYKFKIQIRNIVEIYEIDISFFVHSTPNQPQINPKSTPNQPQINSKSNPNQT